MAAGEEHPALQTLLLEQALDQERLPPAFVEEAYDRARRQANATHESFQTKLPGQHIGAILQPPPLLPKVGDDFFVYDLLHRRLRGGERKRLSAEGEGEKDIFKALHDLAWPNDGRQRMAVRHRLAEAAEIGRHAKIFLRAAARQAKSGYDLVKNEQTPLAFGKFAQLLQELTLRFHDTDGLQNYCGHLVGMLGEDAFQTFDIVVLKGPNQLLDGDRDASIEGGATDVPILPTVIAATRDDLLPYILPIQPHPLPVTGPPPPPPPRGGIGAVLAEARHFGARNHLDQSFGDFALQWMRQGKCCSIRHLPLHGFIDGGIAMTENDRSQRHGVIDIFVAVDVPDMTTVGARQKHRRHALDILCRTLAERLRDRGNQGFSL